VVLVVVPLEQRARKRDILAGVAQKVLRGKRLMVNGGRV
jgi:heme exporter protein D